MEAKNRQKTYRGTVEALLKAGVFSFQVIL